MKLPEVKLPTVKLPKLPTQKGWGTGYWFAKVIFGLVFNVGFKMRIVGIKNIPTRGAYLLASNHVSYFDPPLISGITPTPLHFFARKSLLKNAWLNAIHKMLNIIPVDNEGNDVAAVRIALKTLKENKPLVIFPEGTRSESGQLKRAEPGAGFIASMAKVPVVPVRIFGTFEALPRNSKKPNWGMPITVVIGKPISAEELAVEKGVADRYQVVSDKIMVGIAALEKPAAHTKSELEWAL